MAPTVEKFKAWINEHAPMLANVYDNKYVGMAYDRFASLPSKQQRQAIVGGALFILCLVVLILGSFYLSLWDYSSRSKKYASMVDMLVQYQKQVRARSSQLQNIERNGMLAAPGALKQHLQDQGKSASISPRMIQVEQKDDEALGDEDPKAKKDFNIVRATVKLQRVNLDQLRNFLQGLEYGAYRLGVSSLKVTNDDKIRGYMNAELGVVAYLVHSDEDS